MTIPQIPIAPGRRIRDGEPVVNPEDDQVMKKWGPRTRRLVSFHLLASMIIIGIVAAGLWKLLSEQWLWPDGLAAWLVAANLIAFGYYGVDKWQARLGGDRIPEVNLHALSVLGGSFGAYLGMRLFRHKTLKGTFRVLFWLIVAVQSVLIVWLVTQMI